MKLDKTLKERGGNYGPAKEHFALTKGMYETWVNRWNLSPEWQSDRDITRMIEHVVYMICDKLARASHNPAHLDNWQDIQGYAKLLEDELSKDIDREIDND